MCEHVGAELNALLGRNAITCVRLPSVYGPGAETASRGVNMTDLSTFEGSGGRVGANRGRGRIPAVFDQARRVPDV